MRRWACIVLVLVATVAPPGRAAFADATAPTNAEVPGTDSDIPSRDMGQGGGMEHPDDKPAADIKPRARIVGIVSALGDSIGYQAVNMGLWNGGYNITIPLTGANLDDAAAAMALHALTIDIPGIGIRVIDAPKDTLIAHGNSARLSNGPLDMIREDLKPWRESHDVDLIVVLMPSEGEVDRRGNNDYHRYFFGMGVSGRDAVLFLRVVVLDGKSGEVVSDMKARAVGRLGGSYPEAVFSHPTPEGNQMLAAEMRNLLAGTIPGLLHNAGL